MLMFPWFQEGDRKWEGENGLGREGIALREMDGGGREGKGRTFCRVPNSACPVISDL